MTALRAQGCTHPWARIISEHCLNALNGTSRGLQAGSGYIREVDDYQHSKQPLAMGIILWIVFGAIVGWLASVITNTREGLLLDIIVGVVGAVIGGWVMSLVGNTGVTGFNLYSFVVSLLGAVVLLLVVKAVRRTA